MKLGLIGAGNMASALARGLGEPVLVSDVVGEKAGALAEELGGRAFESNAELARAADVVVLCHKPVQLAEVAADVAGEADTIVSILAATPTSEIERHYPGAAVYRFIPNIPAEVGRGVLCYAPGARAADGPEQEVLQLFGRAGTVIALDEPLIEPAMAIMSCAPAFLALVTEALADGGAKHGLTPDQAIRMVCETMAGTAEYMLRGNPDPEALRRRVATPGGATEKGLIALEEHGLRDAFEAAVDAVVEATRR